MLRLDQFCFQSTEGSVRSGGFSAMNAAAFSAINSFEPVVLCRTDQPAGDSEAKSIVQIPACRRIARIFFFFSERRLRKIADEVHSQSRADARLDFFHGFTPWILTKPQRPYVAWSDCTFRDYIDIFHRREHFSPDDLDRIEQAEAAWLKNARYVLFTSRWAADRAIGHYALERMPRWFCGNLR